MITTDDLLPDLLPHTRLNVYTYALTFQGESSDDHDKFSLITRIN